MTRKDTDSNIPEGFKMTELGPLPEEWEVVKLGSVIVPDRMKVNRNDYDRQTPMVEKIPFGTGTVVFRGKRQTRTDLYVSGEGRLLASKINFHQGAVAVTSMPTAATTHYEFYQVRDVADIQYIWRYFRSEPFMSLFAQEIKFRGFKKEANYKFIRDFAIPLPPLSEQRQIAALLSTVQQAKGKTEAVVEAAKALKRSLTKYLFTYGPVPVGEAERVKLKETEIGEMPEEWEQGKLGTIASVVMGSSPRGETYNTEGMGLPLVNGPAEYGTRHPIPVKWTTKPTRVCERGDIIFCVRGNTTGRMNEADQELCIGRGVAAFSSVEAKSDKGFLWFLLEREAAKILDRATGGGSTFPNINKPELTGWPIPMPPLPEQREMATALLAINEKIGSEETRRQALDQLFKTLLNDLMTGRIRVNNLEVES